MTNRVLIAAAVMFLAETFNLAASLIPDPSPGFVAQTNTFVATNTGDVVAYFYGSGASYDEQLGLFVNGVQLGSYGLDNHTTSVGTMLDFGHIVAGTSLVFAIDVYTTNYVLYSDPSLNSDHSNHAYSTPFTGGGSFPSGTYVGFEDLLLPVSDLNYTDEQFVFTNVSSSPGTPTPEPSNYGVFGIGIGALLYWRFRQRATHLLS